jgi:hypothetical protein
MIRALACLVMAAMPHADVKAKAQELDVPESIIEAADRFALLKQLEAPLKEYDEETMVSHTTLRQASRDLGRCLLTVLSFASGNSCGGASHFVIVSTDHKKHVVGVESAGGDNGLAQLALRRRRDHHTDRAERARIDHLSL